jgi:large repetitive protein
VTPQSATNAAIRIAATVGGVLTVRFGCNPGTVLPGPPEVIQLTDPAPTFASTVSVVQPPTIQTASLSDGEVGLAYSQTLAATGGTPPYTWSVSAGTLPDGLALDGSGAITGTPTTAGTSSFTVQVMDSLGATDTADLSITVTPPVVTDAALDVIVNGPLSSTKTSKALVGKVTNTGNSTIQVCDTNFSCTVPTGSVTMPAACARLGPGASKRFKATWDYGSGLTPGQVVDITGTVTITGDPTPNTDTETRTAK